VTRVAAILLIALAVCVPALAADEPSVEHPYKTCNSPDVKDGEPCVRPPRLIHDVFPEYTDSARKARVQGVVELMLTVDRDGVPAKVEVTRSLRSDLDQKAVEAVRQWRFEPATYEGKPVPVQFAAEVTFRLR
jgi:TonB family protein